MARISRYVDAPYQGISQAPQTTRLEEQVEAAVNGWAILPNGLEKRPPMDLIARLPLGTDWRSDSLFEEIEGKPFALMLQRESATVKAYIYDLATFTAQSLTVSPEAQDYLNTAGVNAVPKDDFRIVTISDTTFVANRQRTVENGVDTEPDRPFEALIWVRQSAYARTYSLTVTENGGTPRTGTYKTPNGATQASNGLIDTDVIARVILNGTAENITTDGASSTGDLADQLIADGFTVTRNGSVIYISNSVDFTITSADGQGGQAMEVIKGTVQSFGGLPAKGFDGFVVRVVQSSGEELDDFFVRFETSTGSTEGTWVETIAPGTSYGLDPETMPLVLTPDGLGGWDLDIGDWQPRQTGDLDLDPDPGFIGEVIEDVSFWKGRLALIYGEEGALSASDDPFLFYRRTLATSLASDTFSVSSPYDKTSPFRYAVTFDKRLVIFSDLAQMTVASEGGITSIDTTSIDVTSQYAFEKGSRPQGVNSRVYFVAPKGSANSAVFELETNQLTDVDEADDVSLAIPRLLPSQLDRVTSIAPYYATCYGKSGTGTIYVHLYRYAEKQRVQNAWFEWSLPAGMVLGGMFFTQDSKLYVLAIEPLSTGNDRAYACVIDITPSRLDPDPASRYLTLLDMRRTEASAIPVYDSLTDTTIIPLLFAGDSNNREVVVVGRAPGGEGGIEWGGQLQTIHEGFPAEIEDVGANSVTVKGDWTDVPFWVGLKYEMRVTLNEFFARDANGRPMQGGGRLSIRQLLTDLSDSGYIEVHIRRGRRTETQHKFQGYVWGDSESLYGVSPQTSTVFSVSVGARSSELSIDYVNDSWFPSRVTSFTWIGEYNPRARQG